MHARQTKQHQATDFARLGIEALPGAGNDPGFNPNELQATCRTGKWDPGRQPNTPLARGLYNLASGGEQEEEYDGASVGTVEEHDL